MRVGSLELRDNLSPADWIVHRIHDFAVDVGSVIPEGFERYVRVFHPAFRIEDGRRVAVQWSEIAAATGRTPHAEMQWANISGVWEHSGEHMPGLCDLEPDVGSLPRPYANRFRDVLSRYTKTPDHVWFAVWDGFGGLKVRPGGTAFLSFGVNLRIRARLLDLQAEGQRVVIDASRPQLGGTSIQHHDHRPAAMQIHTHVTCHPGPPCLTR